MTIERPEGRDEPIIDPDLAIIDAHHHLFDRPALRYMLEDYLADASAGHNIIGSVYVETQAFAVAGGPEVMRPLGEIEFANGVGAMAASGVYGDCRVCMGIVGFADLRHGDAIAALLDRAQAAAPDRFRGVRQVTIEHPSEAPFRFMTHRPPAGVLRHENFRAGIRQLARRGLIFDAAVFHRQLPDIAAIADAFPDTPIVLNHMGLAMGMEMDLAQRQAVFQDWRTLLRDAARRPNLFCKVGGMGMPFWGFGFESRSDRVDSGELSEAWRPYVESAIEIFGTSRCMMESNFPPDRRSCGFVPLWNALKRITQQYTDDEKRALYSGVAAGVYRLEVSSTREAPGADPRMGAGKSKI
jgi:predicted TIM-barrel fold metal-dependent hydrolase